MRRALIFGIVAALFWVPLNSAFAQRNADAVPPEDPLAGISWVEAGGDATLGSLAHFRTPESCRFTGAAGAAQFLTATENIPDGDELGIVYCALPNDAYWFAIFSFDETGYVRDDEKDKLDADAIIASLRKGTSAANEERRKRGWSTMDVVGWSTAPFYDPQTNNLTWAIIGASSEGHNVVNHSVRMLGRSGVMKVQLVTEPDARSGAVAALGGLLSNYEFTSGNRYSEWREGDNVATYGLTALIAGGAGAALAKSGLLAKMWKLVVVLLVAVGAAVRGAFSKLRGSSGSAA